MRTLCTFSGKFGDILWSLATVDAIGKMLGEYVDFACMPQYESLIPLIQAQPYVEKAFTIPEWVCTGSPHGDQPWQPPQTVNLRSYDRQYHLTYKGHPGITPGMPRMPLIDFIAWQQGIKFVKSPVPFLTYDCVLPTWTSPEVFGVGFVAYAFNSDYADQKKRFLESVEQAGTGLNFVDVGKQSWLMASLLLKRAVAFVGCRSANWVLACGVGQKNIFTYEPNPARNKWGMFGDVFGCPYVDEQTLEPHSEEWARNSVEEDADRAARKCVELIQTWKDNYVVSV